MTSGSVSKKRRKLLVIIPPDQKRIMKEQIYQLGKTRNDALQAIRAERRKEQRLLDDKYDERVDQIRRKFERNRSSVIEQFEQAYGKAAVQEVLS